MIDITDDRAASRPRVLLAEDDDDLRSLLAGCLEAEGYHAIEVEDGLELEDYLELTNGDVSRRLQPDLILTDIEMPGRNGLEVLRRARQQGITCPCIVISAFADDDALRYATKSLGLARILAKPFAVEALIALVAQLAASPANDLGRSRHPASAH